MLLALLVGAGMLLVSVLLYATATALIVQLLVYLTGTGSSGWGFWKDVAVMMVVTLITAAAHLTVIALWAVVYLLCGEIANFEKALYCSAENYIKKK